MGAQTFRAAELNLVQMSVISDKRLSFLMGADHDGVAGNGDGCRDRGAHEEDTRQSDPFEVARCGDCAASRDFTNKSFDVERSK